MSHWLLLSLRLVDIRSAAVSADVSVVNNIRKTPHFMSMCPILSIKSTLLNKIVMIT